MKYTAGLPLPGGDRTTVITVAEAGSTITNPYVPEELCPAYDVAVTEENLTLKAMVGRTEFVFHGVPQKDGWLMTFTTHETIPLEPGTRLSGTSGQLAGEYLVGVYSPGGVRENHFVMKETPEGYTGEMYGLVDQKTLDFMASMMAGPGPGGPGSPGGPGEMPPGAPPMEPMPIPKLGDKTDVNPFIAVSGTPEHFEVVTVTGKGSQFRFEGAVTGDTIAMTLHVTDVAEGVRAVRA